MFLQENGLDLFLKLLKVFANDAAVETKVLGLLNNIAEVSPLRSALINKNFLCQLEYVDLAACLCLYTLQYILYSSWL